MNNHIRFGITLSLATTGFQAIRFGRTLCRYKCRFIQGTWYVSIPSKMDGVNGANRLRHILNSAMESAGICTVRYWYSHMDGPKEHQVL
jgi:hypothetical protein